MGLFSSRFAQGFGQGFRESREQAARALLQARQQAAQQIEAEKQREHQKTLLEADQRFKTGLAERADLRAAKSRANERAIADRNLKINLLGQAARNRQFEQEFGLRLEGLEQRRRTEAAAARRENRRFGQQQAIIDRDEKRRQEGLEREQKRTESHNNAISALAERAGVDPTPFHGSDPVAAEANLRVVEKMVALDQADRDRGMQALQLLAKSKLDMIGVLTEARKTNATLGLQAAQILGSMPSGLKRLTEPGGVKKFLDELRGNEDLDPSTLSLFSGYITNVAMLARQMGGDDDDLQEMIQSHLAEMMRAVTPTPEPAPEPAPEPESAATPQDPLAPRGFITPEQLGGAARTGSNFLRDVLGFPFKRPN